MSVETILTRTMKEVPKALAAGVVDMSTGMLLGVKTVDSHPRDVLELVAGATKEMFEGDNVRAIEDIFKARRGVDSSERLIKEVTFSTPMTLHIFERLQSSQSTVVLAVCAVDTNLGLALMKMRAIRDSESI